MSQGVALVVFYFCTREEREGYELVNVRHRESPPLPPQTSELEVDVRGFLCPCFPQSTPPHNHPHPHLTAGCEDTVYEVIRGDHNYLYLHNALNNLLVKTGDHCLTYVLFSNVAMFNYCGILMSRFSCLVNS